MSPIAISESGAIKVQTGEELGPKLCDMTCRPDDRSGKKNGIARIFADPAHRMWPPIATERDIKPDAMTCLSQRLSDVFTHAQEHLEFPLISRPTAVAGTAYRMIMEPSVVRGDDRIKALIPR